MEPVSAATPARAGLLGNPSDIYGGKAIAFALSNFEATARIEAALACQIGPAPPETLCFGRLPALAARLSEPISGEERLLRGALVRFGRAFPVLAQLPEDHASLHFKLQFESSIPLQVGLGGSSAVMVSTLRALAQWFEVSLPPLPLAALALEAEVDELGILAGPMDRIIQTHGGVLHMDFAEPMNPHSYVHLSEKLLPPLFLAWDPRGGQPSGVVHEAVRERWLSGDDRVRQGVARFPALVDAGMRALEARDNQAFRAAVDENFDTRASLWELQPRDFEMIAIARSHRAAAKFAGSGGAVVGVMTASDDYPQIATAYQAAGYRTLRPDIAPVTERSR